MVVVVVVVVVVVFIQCEEETDSILRYLSNE